MGTYVLAIDEGTTSVRSILYDVENNFHSVGQDNEKIIVKYGENGVVEQEANNIFESTVKTMRGAVKAAGVSPEEIACIGISTQRCAWAFWDKETGEPIADMVGWQDTRTVHLLESTKSSQRFQEMCKYYTPYLKGSSLCLKLPYYLEQHPEIAKMLEEGKLLFGTVDTWLVYKLTGGKVFATDITNASTLGSLHDETNDWDYHLLCDYAGLPKDIFAEVKANADDYGMMTADILGCEIPITGVIADQQAALFSQGCHEVNTGKCTNGTGSFLTVNIGKDHKMLDVDTVVPTVPRVAYKVGDDTYWMIESFCTTTGSALEWVKNKLELFDDISKLEGIAESVGNNNGVYFVPAMTGMNVPYLDLTARGSFMGLSLSATRAHMVRASLEAVSYVVCAAFQQLQEAFGIKLEEVKISGGVSKSNIMDQTMANLLDIKVDMPETLDASSLGAAEVAAIKRGLITQLDAKNLLKSKKVYVPDEHQEECKENYKMWLKAVDRSSHWVE